MILPMPEGRTVAASILPFHRNDVLDLSIATQHRVDAQREAEEQRTKAAENEISNPRTNRESDQNGDQTLAQELEKLLGRIRKLFAMSQETQASPYEVEVALRRCQSLMARYAISETDLNTSQFTTEAFRAGNRVPMHIAAEAPATVTGTSLTVRELEIVQRECAQAGQFSK